MTEVVIEDYASKNSLRPSCLMIVSTVTLSKREPITNTMEPTLPTASIRILSANCVELSILTSDVKSKLKTSVKDYKTSLDLTSLKLLTLST